MARETDSPQVKDSPRADAEWKADPGLSNLVHGSEGSGAKSSNKDAPLPKYEASHEEVAGGQGSGGKGWTGSGKGDLNKDTK
ncbi:hypothetical protein V496_01968 [Pseudogymnoascus sp. VKM F-4515 (FW-2607)]|nr:hypothetical protein V496_01968 [Pseudogymnoascus sp. VKM F-4515 (FW-2607)]